MTTRDLHGFEGLDATLADLSRGQSAGVQRRAMAKALEPMARMARQNAPRDEGILSESIEVTHRLTARQRARAGRKPSGIVEMFMGPTGSLEQAVPQEFGTYKMPAHPYMRPAWMAKAETALAILRVELWDEITKAAARNARRRLRG